MLANFFFLPAAGVVVVVQTLCSLMYVFPRQTTVCTGTSSYCSYFLRTIFFNKQRVPDLVHSKRILGYGVTLHYTQVKLANFIL